MHSVFHTLWLATVLLVAALPAQAQITVAQSTSQDITAFGVCLTVTNTCDGDIMIPNASSAEFLAVPNIWGSTSCAETDFCGNAYNYQRTFSNPCAITTNRTAMCWGQGTSGQRGDGTTAGPQTVPVLVSGGYTWRAISPGGVTTCGVRTDGTAMCWGWGSLGQLGDGTSGIPQSSPVTVSGGYTWRRIDVGDSTTCGIRTDSVAMCWGNGNMGTRGDGTTTSIQTTPITVSGGYTWRTISVGADIACGVRTDNVAMCWGSGSSGQRGDGTTTATQTTPAVVSGGYSWRLVSVGTFTTCGIRTDDVAMCWGVGAAGQLGNGGTGNSTTPVVVSGGYTWRSITTSNNTSCGVRTDGTAMCWGLGMSGQLGDGTTTASQTTPSTVSGGYTWRSVSLNASGGTACGVRTDGVAMCWGSAANGSRGDGTSIGNQTTPVTVSGGYTW